MNEITRKMLEEVSTSKFWETSETLKSIKVYEKEGADLHAWGDYILCRATYNLDAPVIEYLVNDCGLSLTKTFDCDFEDNEEAIHFSFINARNGRNAICSLISNEKINEEDIEDILISLFKDFDIKDDNIYFEAWSTLLVKTGYSAKKIENMINKDNVTDFNCIAYNSINCEDTFDSLFVKIIVEKYPKFVDSSLNDVFKNLYLENNDHWIDFCEGPGSDESTIFNMMKEKILPTTITDDIYIKLGKAFIKQACENNNDKKGGNTRDEILVLLDALYGEEKEGE